MKNILILLSLITSSLFANIGEITALRGKATLVHDGVSSDAKVGTSLDVHDELKTQTKSKLQIVFKDKTVISLGQKSHFKIDEYIYNDKKVSAKFAIKKGFFKSITGRIGKIAPKRFKIKTANATIGVRGTTIIGEVTTKRDIIACSRGEIVVSNSQGSRLVTAGERTIVQSMKMPTTPQKVNRVILNQLNSKSDTTTQEAPIPNIESATKKDEVKNDVDLKDQKSAKKFEPWVDTKKRDTLEDIERVVGSKTATYRGKVVEGSTTLGGKIDKESSDVRLGFDFGTGRVNGDLKFKDETNIDYDVEVSGKVRGDATFDFSSKSGYGGGGKGELSGEKFKKANGDFSFVEADEKAKKIFNKIDGKFETSR